MVDVVSLYIPDVKIITPRRFGDDRGFFSEVYNRETFYTAGISADFCQDNHSLSAAAGTLRGLHYQAPPYAQAKLVRVAKGSILDVVVDARRSSPSFGNWVSAEISAAVGNQIFVPQGFLHGFVTLVPDTEVIYKVDAHYNAAADGSVFWNDPDLAIDWGQLPISGPILSPKDEAAEAWRDFNSPFD